MSEFIEFRKIPRLNRDIVITEKIDGTNAQVLIADASGFTPGVAAPDAPLMIVVRGDERLGVWAGSRNRWLSTGTKGNADNFGFAAWVAANAVALVDLFGPGRVFGEWWGAGIQRRYGLAGKAFSPFNVGKYGEQTAYLDPRCNRPGIPHGPEAEIVHQTDRAGVKRCACRDARPALDAVVGGVPVRPVPVLYRGPWFIEDWQDITDGDNADTYPLTAFPLWAPKYATDLLRREGSKAAPGFMDPEGIVTFHEASGQLFKTTIQGDEKPKGETR